MSETEKKVAVVVGAVALVVWLLNAWNWSHR